jgi:hypothetical protein
VIERSQSDTIPSSASSSHDEIFRAVALAGEASRLKSNVAIDLHRLEIELARAMRKVPIGAAEGRRLFALRARVRLQLANRGELAKESDGVD